LTCTGGGIGGGSSVEDFSDVDWVCTYDYDGEQGHLYVQSTPVSCVWMMSAQATYETQSAQVSIDGQLHPLENAQYFWGGNHRNDYLTFEYDGRSYDYNHSSFGSGWRACQNMDCMTVDDHGDLDDGCTVDRTLPVICVKIESDGTHAPLVDTFEPCPGDPNYE
jgi:hypothetical protein